MRPPPEAEAAAIAGVSLDELLSVLTSEPDGLPQPETPTIKRNKRPTLEAKLLTRLARLVEDAALIGVRLKIEWGSL